MPTYDYACVNCETTCSDTCSIQDKQDTFPCAICGAKMRQVYTPPVITFNGRGFYANDKKEK